MYELSEEDKTAIVTKPVEGKYYGSVVIPENITYNDISYVINTIGDEAFENCTELKEVIIPMGVKKLSFCCFYGCSGLSTIEIPEGVKEIGWSSFSDCTGLTSIIIPESVETIYNYAFSGCSGISSVFIPKNVSCFAINAFFNCSNLTSIVVDENNTYYDSRDNCNAIIETATNRLISGCQSTVIPESVDIIAFRAFGDNIKSIYIPKNIYKIEEDAFLGCNNLVSITIDPGNMYYNSDNNCNAIVETATNTIIAGCLNTTINANIKHIGNHAFMNLYDLSSITLPDGLISIGDGAFHRCYNLPSINIPNSVTSIGRDAFFACHSFSSFTFPDKIQTLSESVLQYCRLLNTVTIPDGVTTIGLQAFAGDSALVSAIIPSSVSFIEKYAFTKCTSLTEVNIPNGVKVISDDTFSSCKSITSITIPEGVKTIGKNAFGGSGLKSILIPSTVEEIDEWAFNIKNSPSVTIYATKPPIIESNTFPYREDQTLYVPEGYAGVYETAEYWKEFGKIIEIGSTQEGSNQTSETRTKLIRNITWTDGKDTDVAELKYDDKGRIIEYYINGALFNIYTYKDNEIKITEGNDTYSYTISDGRIISGKTYLDGDEVDIDRYFTYNNNSQLISIVNKEKESGYSEIYTITDNWEWNGSNLSSWYEKDEEDTKSSTFTYNDLTAEPIMRTLFGFSQELHLDDFYDMLALYPYLGTLPKNLFKNVKNKDAEKRDWEYKYSYEQDGNGNIVKVIVTFKDKIYVYTFDWEYSETSPSWINIITKPDNTEDVYYNLNGQRITNPVRNGIYIKNGKTILLRR